MVLFKILPRKRPREIRAACFISITHPPPHMYTPLSHLPFLPTVPASFSKRQKSKHTSASFSSFPCKSETQGSNGKKLTVAQTFNSASASYLIFPLPLANRWEQLFRSRQTTEKSHNSKVVFRSTLEHTATPVPQTSLHKDMEPLCTMTRLLPQGGKRAPAGLFLVRHGKAE